MDPTRRRLPISLERQTPWASGPPAGAAPAGTPVGSIESEGTGVSPRLTEEFPPGSVLGDFEVVRELGRGGLGIVLEAQQLSRDRRVALKVLDPRLSANRRAVARFREEAALAARVVHPGIVPVLFAGSASGREYYAESLMAGSLEEFIDQATDLHGEAFFRDIALRFADLARSLDALHRSGILHRGIKPSNLFFQDRRIVLGDFKMALSISAAGPGDGAAVRPEVRFRDEGLARKPVYMAPEEFVLGGDPDPRADVYSLGMALYELSTGILPFPRCSVDCMARLKLTRRPIAPRRLNPEIPLGLEAVIHQAIEANPLLRHATAEDLARDLERFASRKRGSVRRHPSQGPDLEGDGGEEGEEDLPELARIA